MGQYSNDPNQFSPVNQPTVKPPPPPKQGKGNKGGDPNLPDNPLKGYFDYSGNSIFDPPKTLAPRPWGTWILTTVGVLATIGVVFVLISALTNNVADVQQSVDNSSQAVVGAVRDELANLPQTTLDTSGIEAQLGALSTQNADLLLRSGTLEAQLNVALTGIATTPDSVAFASNTPPAEVVTTTDTTTNLDVNGVILKTNTPIHLAPNLEDGPFATLSADAQLYVEGIFTDIQGQQWLVFEPDSVRGLANNMSDENTFYSREQVFVQYPLDEFIVHVGFSEQPPALRLTITDAQGRFYRATPESNVTTNIIKRGITGVVTVLDVVRNDQNAVEWVRVDVSNVEFTAEELAVKGEQPYVFISININNAVAFSGFDLAILERMPNTPAELIPVSATTQPTATPAVQLTATPNVNLLATPTP